MRPKPTELIHAVFAAYFALSGLVLQCLHRLDGDYIALIGAVQGLLLLHSGAQSYFASKGPTDGGNVTTSAV